MSQNGKGAPLGNTNASKGKPITEAIVKELAEECEIVNDNGKVKTRKLYALARKLVDRAIEDGDMAAIKEVMDRVEGKPHQSVNVSNENPLGEFDTGSLASALAIIRALTEGQGDTPEADRGGAIH